MDITFETPELREFCESLDLCEATYGEQAARDLFTLVSDVESCRNIAELEDIHQITAAGDSISICVGAQLVAEFVNGSVGGGVDPDEPIDWRPVRRLRLVSISA